MSDTDIVERLRFNHFYKAAAPMMKEGADRIERLEADVERLKAEQRYTFDDWRVLVEAQQLLEKMPQTEVKP